MVCTRKTKTLVSTCVILSGMTNIICLLYVGWVTNYIASVYVRGQEPAPDRKLEEDKGETLRIIERLDHLENVIKQHIQGTRARGAGRVGGSRSQRPGARRRDAGGCEDAAPERGTPSAVRASPGARVCCSLAVRGALHTCPNVRVTPGWSPAGSRDPTQVRLQCVSV